MYKEILRKIGDKKAQDEIRRLFDEEKPDEMLKYIGIYATSVESLDEKDNRSKKAREFAHVVNVVRSFRLIGNWKLEMLESLSNDTEPGINYQSDGEAVCPVCRNCVSAGLVAQEEPIGTLKSCDLTFVRDSLDTGKTKVEIPKILFYDR